MKPIRSDSPRSSDTEPATTKPSATSQARVGVFSSGIRAIPHLDVFLGARIVVSPTERQAGQLDAVVGWGNKATSRRAREFAAKVQVPFWRLEDGFIRSVAAGSSSAPLSLVVDDMGIYYDATRASRLEAILSGAESADPLRDPALLERAARCMQRVLEARISKYNDSLSSLPAKLAQLHGPCVLVVDQTRSDASVTLGQVPEGGFDRMLQAALDEHPTATVLIKTHPEVINGTKLGYLTAPGLESDRIVVVGEAVNPLALLERVDHVYACTSQLGFEALLLEKPVTCFGAPFYSGWGLTRDTVATERRNRRRTIQELVAAAWLLYPRYVHPVRGERCGAEEIIEHLALQRDMFANNAKVTHCVGFSLWKRPYVRAYLGGPGSKLTFARRSGALKRGTRPDRVVVWGQRDNQRLQETCQALSVPIVRMEDGFLRSVGLGSDLTAPSSLVLDERGIYYDPTKESDLERLLAISHFSEPELKRAAALRAAIVAARLSKYNSAVVNKLELGPSSGSRRVLLVPGQVEDDASVQLGAVDIKTNEGLLTKVRTSNADAFIVYKPHPDVVTRNRRGALSPAAESLADHVARDVSLPACLAAVQEVHTLTSLVGFEALLRGMPVTVYGRPFYAGWGLTKDHAPAPRRTRRLTIDELVAGALLRYPRYYSFHARGFVTAEDIVFELSSEMATPRRNPLMASWPLRQYRKLANLATEIRRAL